MKHICDICGWEYDEELGYPAENATPLPLHTQCRDFADTIKEI